MKRIGLVFLVLALAMCALLPAFGETAGTLLQNEPDRAITPQGLDENGNFPVNPVIPGESPTTGLPWTGVYLPVLVQISNANGGLSTDPGGPLAPWGTEEADIIYETPLHKNGNTRQSFFYSDQYPEGAGPIRSLRIVHVELREEWDALMVHQGQQEYPETNVLDYLRKTGAKKRGLVFDGNASSPAWAKYFYNDSKNAPNHRGAKIAEMIQFIPEDHTPLIRPYLFTDEASEGLAATEIKVDNAEKDYQSSFTYDPATNTYARFVRDIPFVDKYTENQLTFANVIIQRTKVSYRRRDAPEVMLIGSGNADIFMGGKYIAGYWMRTATDQRTVFMDENGNEIQLQRGKTYIDIVDSSIGVTYYE